MRVIDVLEWCYYIFFRKHDLRDPVSRLLAPLPHDTTILDFGGGDGRVTTLRLDARWIVADVDSGALRNVPRGDRVAAILVDSQPPYPFQDGRFSTILLVDVLHHLAHPVETLAALASDVRTTLVGSITPAFTRSSNLSVKAL